ncbi:MAG: prenyltransferase/squalene oxidase repeat-containing protein [Gemmataceae bacterium]
MLNLVRSGVALALLGAFVSVQAAVPKSADKTAEKAVAYLKKTQAENGSWGGKAAPGMTGIVVTGLLRSGKVGVDDPAVAKALKYIEGLVNDKEGHLAGSEPNRGIINYATSVNIMALTSADPGGKKYGTIVKRAADYLKSQQWDESEGKTPKDIIYGGAGYGGGTRPDLSNTQFFLDALKAAGVPKDDPAFKRAAIFVSRCQNLKGEDNRQEWAGKINDGSFIYRADGDTRGTKAGEGGIPGYGSMTYAGLKSLILCSVPETDERYKKAFGWIQKHYTVDSNPGMPPDAKLRGLYYYLMSMSKCLDVMGANEVTDAAGKKHDWRDDITKKLVGSQQADGSWVNDTASWMESNPDLCTAYALITLSYCAPKK